MRTEPTPIDRKSMLVLLEELVSFESPSRDKAALDRLGAYIAGILRKIGGVVEVVPNDRGGDHVLARFPGPAGRRPALVLGHFDTVWPVGTLDRMPFRVEDGRAYGPGVYDMKAGLTIFLRLMAEAFGRPGPIRPAPDLGPVHLGRGDRQPDVARA